MPGGRKGGALGRTCEVEEGGERWQAAWRGSRGPLPPDTPSWEDGCLCILARVPETWKAVDMVYVSKYVFVIDISERNLFMIFLVPLWVI